MRKLEEDIECRRIRAPVGRLDREAQDPPPGFGETDPVDLVNAWDIGCREPWLNWRFAVMLWCRVGNLDRSTTSRALTLIGDLDRPCVAPPRRDGQDVAGKVNLEKAFVAHSCQGGDRSRSDSG